MGKRIFINNFDTYVSKAVFTELQNDEKDAEGNMPEEPNLIFGSYINKDSSDKPSGVKKMLKVSRQLLTLCRDPSHACL
jgi:hypothetical protein